MRRLTEIEKSIALSYMAKKVYALSGGFCSPYCDTMMSLYGRCVGREHFENGDVNTPMSLSSAAKVLDSIRFTPQK